MPPERSDSPARVERFGDPLHILEGLALNTESDFVPGRAGELTPSTGTGGS